MAASDSRHRFIRVENVIGHSNRDARATRRYIGETNHVKIRVVASITANRDDLLSAKIERGSETHLMYSHRIVPGHA